MTGHSSPAIRLPLGKSVLAVELYDLVANQVIVTFHRPRSHCTFTEEWEHGQFAITLRLDWGDLLGGEPMLDMDVALRNDNGTKKRLRPNKNHHTRLSSLIPGSTEPRGYYLEYEGLRMRLVTRKTFAIEAGMSIYVFDPGAK